MKRPASQNKQDRVLLMAFQVQKACDFQETGPSAYWAGYNHDHNVVAM